MNSFSDSDVYSDIGNESDDSISSISGGAPLQTSNPIGTTNIIHNIISIPDYSKLTYPLKMIGGSLRTHKFKSLDKQLMHPNNFCRQLDKPNQNHCFTIEQYCLAWEYAVNQVWGSKTFDLTVFKEARPGLDTRGLVVELERERERCVGIIRDEQLMTRAQRLMKHKETAVQKWKKAMKRGHMDEADLIAIRLMKRFDTAGEKLDDGLSQQLSLDNLKIANLGLSWKQTKLKYRARGPRVPPIEKAYSDDFVIIVYVRVGAIAPGHLKEAF